MTSVTLRATFLVPKPRTKSKIFPGGGELKKVAEHLQELRQTGDFQEPTAKQRVHVQVGGESKTINENFYVVFLSVNEKNL